MKPNSITTDDITDLQYRVPRVKR